MRVIYNNNYLCDIPDIMSIGDTILYKNEAFEINTKTFDYDNDELYCKVINYENINNTDNFYDIIKKIYYSDYFETSGINTNEILTNPRLITLMIISSVVINNKHMEENGHLYKNNIIANWNNKFITWPGIFNDNPPVSNRSISEIKKLAIYFLKESKISKSIWPKGLKN
jgi:hypothetical protein